MSNAPAQPDLLPPPSADVPTSRRLDAWLTAGLVVEGTRFLYTVNGAGKVFEGTLGERSAGGYVKLNDSNCWDWPEELFVEEILSQPKSAPAPAAPVGLPVVPLTDGGAGGHGSPLGPPGAVRQDPVEGPAPRSFFKSKHKTKHS